MYKHETQIRVRYSETDKMGYLYYGNYASYLEVARVESMRSMGLSYREMEDNHNIALPVAHYETKYIRPAYYDSLLTLKSEVREMPESFMVFHTDIFNEEGKIINRSTVKLAFVTTDGKRTTAPQYMIDKLKSYF